MISIYYIMNETHDYRMVQTKNWKVLIWFFRLSGERKIALFI